MQDKKRFSEEKKKKIGKMIIATIVQLPCIALNKYQENFSFIKNKS